MRERMRWVFFQPCGCPFGVLSGTEAAPTRSGAWREFFADATERDKAMDRGVTVERMDHARYVAEVYPRMRGDFVCPHQGVEAGR